MAFFKYVVPALAVVSGAAAQGSSCSNSATTTIQNSGDASALAACTTFSGSIAIATGTSDNIDLTGLRTIDGDLVANNATNLGSLSSSTLQEITGDFTLGGLTVLSTLNFPRLTDINNIVWTALPALQGIVFTTGVQKVKALTIDNTFLASLTGINLQVADTINIVNNLYLTTVNMQLGNVTTAMLLGNNGKDLMAEFPNLLWANRLTFRNTSTVTLDSLASVNNTMGFYGGTMDSISAPNLTSVGSQLSVVSCMAVTNVSMPLLTRVTGGFQIANNTDLEAIDFPAVQMVGGALDFEGSFGNASLPALNDVRGAFTMTSTQDLTSTCNHFKTLAGQNAAIKGTFICNGHNATAGSSTGSGGSSGTGSGSSSSSTPSSFASAVVIPGATGLLGLVAALFGLL